MEGHLLGYLDILYYTLSSVSSKLGSIDFDLEAKSINYLNLCRLKPIQLNHTLNLSEMHVISILELVPLVFVHSHYARVTLRGVSYDEGLGVLAISVSHYEVVAIV